MAAITPEVWEPNPIIPVPGTYVPRFNRYYLSINPNPAEGPPTWRISDPDEFPCGEGIFVPVPPGQIYSLVSVAPLVIQGDDENVEFSMDISTVTDVDVPSDRKLFSITDFTDIPRVTGVSGNPILSAVDVNDKAVVLTFSFGNLPDVPDKIKKSLTTTVSDYNINEYSQFGTVYTSTDPIELHPSDGLTRVTLNINSLPPAP